MPNTYLIFAYLLMRNNAKIFPGGMLHEKYPIPFLFDDFF